MVLIEDIKGLSKENFNKFLEETVSGYLLEQLKNKIDVQNYFKTIIFSLVEKMEADSSFKKINLNIKQIQKDFNFEKELMKKIIQKSDMKNKKKKLFFRKNLSRNK